MPLSPDVAQRILDCGALAPSGDNLQPWTVHWVGEALHLAVDRTRDLSLYNVNYQASLIALGAMIENMTIAARHSALEPRVDVSATGDGGLPSATLTFEHSSAPASEPLFDSIARRCTNRKPYRKVPIEPAVLAALQASIPADGTAALRFFEDPAEMRVLARAASLNDRLLFELRPLHDAFFESVRWTPAEVEASRDGLDVRTLELGPMAAGFKAMRSWTVARFATRLGSGRMAPMHSFRTFLRSSAFGFLQMERISPGDFVQGGRYLQRLWLTATAQGLSFQPMAGMLYLLAYLSPERDAVRDERQRVVLRQADGVFRRALPLDPGRAPIMLFRIGYGASPSATSLRRSLPV